MGGGLSGCTSNPEIRTLFSATSPFSLPATVPPPAPAAPVPPPAPVVELKHELATVRV